MDKMSHGHCEEVAREILLHRHWTRLDLLFQHPERFRDLPGSHSIWDPTRSDPYLLECSGQLIASA